MRRKKWRRNPGLNQEKMREECIQAQVPVWVVPHAIRKNKSKQKQSEQLQRPASSDARPPESKHLCAVSNFGMNISKNKAGENKEKAHGKCQVELFYSRRQAKKRDAMMHNNSGRSNESQKGQPLQRSGSIALRFRHLVLRAQRERLHEARL
jgi:hypothetical protein